MEIYFTRHPESTGNAAETFQGKETKLSEKGTQETEGLIRRFRGAAVELIISSPFARARQAAEAVAAGLTAPMVLSDHLAEVRWPSEIDGLSHNDPKAVLVRDKISEMYHLGNWRYSDEETFEELRARGVCAAEELANMQQKNIAVISHGDIMKMVMALMLFGDEVTPKMFQKFKRNFKIHNAGVSLLEGEGNAWRLVYWNNRSHLA